MEYQYDADLTACLISKIRDYSELTAINLGLEISNIQAIFNLKYKKFIYKQLFQVKQEHYSIKVKMFKK